MCAPCEGQTGMSHIENMVRYHKHKTTRTQLTLTTSQQGKTSPQQQQTAQSIPRRSCNHHDHHQRTHSQGSQSSLSSPPRPIHSPPFSLAPKKKQWRQRQQQLRQLASGMDLDAPLLPRQTHDHFYRLESSRSRQPSWVQSFGRRRRHQR